MNLLDFKKTISEKRVHLMGWAMILVWLYHFLLYTYNPFGPFLRSIGVDIFVFLSGFGLSYSVSRKSLLDFYLSRFSKITFLYLTLCISMYCIGGGCPRTTDHKSEILQSVSSSDDSCLSNGNNYQLLGGNTSNPSSATYNLKVENSQNGVLGRPGGG